MDVPEFEEERSDPLEPIVERINERLHETNREHTVIEEYIAKFTEDLFGALESFTKELIANGVPGIAPPKRFNMPTGKAALQLQIADIKIIFVQMAGLAWPNPRDEARVPGVKFKEECGRVAVFLTENPDRASFYDFLIWGDGSWFAWGYGWPKQDAKYEDTNFKLLAAELLDSFIKDIHRTWKTRAETILGDATSANVSKRGFTYGLPGDE